VDYNRVSVLVAMLEKRLGIPMVGCDIYLNAAGGLEINEPASDAGICAAILSSFRNRPIQAETVIVGELGLAGEVRPVASIVHRVREAALMRFRRCILPAGNLPVPERVEGIELVPVTSIAQLSETLFSSL
jgi:DNA repair protein RadA/Sms